MAYIGREPQIGNFQVCDAISTVNNQAAYTMQVGGVNVSPESANHMLVSLNGILQAPTSSFTVSGSTITFASNLVTGDVIDFIQILGNVLDLGVPSDNTVSLAKLTATGTKDATTFLRGDNTFAAAGLNGWSEDGANNNLLPASASAGIYLGVTSATAANLLDDYEEGTWTPVVGGVSLGAVGFYSKVGRVCIVSFGNQTGAGLALNNGDDYAIAGLPFSMIATDWNYGSVPSASFADASASYHSQPLTGRQQNSGNIHIINRSGIDVTSSDPVNVSMVYQTN